MCSSSSTVGDRGEALPDHVERCYDFASLKATTCSCIRRLWAFIAVGETMKKMFRSNRRASAASSVGATVVGTACSLMFAATVGCGTSDNLLSDARIGSTDAAIVTIDGNNPHVDAAVVQLDAGPAVVDAIVGHIDAASGSADAPSVGAADASVDASAVDAAPVDIDATLPDAAPAAPSVHLTGQPTALSDDDQPTFTFASDDGVTFTCAIDDVVAASACASPWWPDVALPAGDYVFRLVATNGDNVSSEVDYDWTVSTPVCGNGVIEAGEQCDDTNTDVCTASCTLVPVTWTQLTPSHAPGAREHAAMAYDVLHRETVLFGGFSGGVVADTWTFDGANWTQHFPASSPLKSYTTTMAYDAARQQIVLFGGSDSSGADAAQTWTWDGTTWTQLSPAQSPPIRQVPCMAYDGTSQKLILFGGYGVSNNTLLNDTWEWDGTNWTQATTTDAPSPRVNSMMAYDDATGLLMLFGGYPDGGSTSFNDTWAWTGRDWTQLNPKHPATPREVTLMAYDALRQRIVLFGGDPSPLHNDTQEWDGTDWTDDAPLVITPGREFSNMVYDVANSNIMVFGGFDNVNGGDRGDTWVFSSTN